jgi:hypothetical protein
MKNRLLLACALVGSTLGGAISLISAPGAGAATDQVTNCNDSGSGSLRAALGVAGPGDKITFALSPSCSSITLTSGILDISTNVQIDGPGASDLAVNGNDTSGVFYVGSGVTASISGLTIEGGNGSGTPDNNQGGGIDNNGNLTLSDSIVSNNTGIEMGGGIANMNGHLTVADSTISNNSVTTGSTGAAWGGGIGSGNTTENSPGTVTVLNSTVTDNMASATGFGVGGGGLFASGNGALTVRDSTISGNMADNVGNGDALGGGVDTGTAMMTIANSTVSNNDAESVNGNSVYGGAIENGGMGIVTDSTLSGNSATDPNGGGAFGGGLNNYGTVLINNSTIADDTATRNAGGGGGGLNNFGTMTVVEATIASNSESPSSTSASIDNGGNSLTLAGTIVAQGSTPECFGPITDGGYNLADDTSCGLSSANHSLPATDPDLGPPQNNGGATETLLPALGSPAVAAIPLDTTLAGVQVCPRLDQRSIASDGNCTIGAVEGGFLITTTSLPDATPGMAYGPVTLATQEAGISTPPHLTRLTWSGVSLPSWLTLSSTGVLSGNPSEKLKAKTRSIMVSVTETVTTVTGNTKVKTKTTVPATIPLTVS